MIRLRTSRPSGSVPRGNADVGGCIRSGKPFAFRLKSYGSWGASTGARIATANKLRMTSALIAPIGRRRTMDTTSSHTRAARRARGVVGNGRARSAVADSRIKPGVAQVDDQVGRDDDRGEKQDRALDQGVVPQHDGFEHQTADAGLQEDELDDDRP